MQPGQRSSQRRYATNHSAKRTEFDSVAARRGSNFVLVPELERDGDCRIPGVLRLWDRDAARVEVVEVLELPANLRQAVTAATKQRRQLEERSRAVQREMEHTIRRLQTQLKLGVRDSGELLGISPRYAHKLRHAESAGRSESVRKAAATRLSR